VKLEKQQIPINTKDSQKRKDSFQMASKLKSAKVIKIRILYPSLFNPEVVRFRGNKFCKKLAILKTKS